MELCDRDFFRATVVPFIERMMREHRRITVIHEFRGTANAESVECRRALETLEGEVQKALIEYLDRGKNIDLGLLNPEILEWIAKANAKRPETVTNIVESQLVQMRHDGVPARLPSTSKIEVRVDGLAYRIALARSRNCAVAEQIRGLRREDPDRAIVVPRNMEFAGLSRQIDRNEFEIQTEHGKISPIAFEEQAMLRAAFREIGRDELARFVRRAMYAEDFRRTEGWSREYRDIAQTHPETALVLMEVDTLLYVQKMMVRNP
jgi:hypothetical protein